MDKRNFSKSSCAVCEAVIVGSMAFLESCSKGGVSPSAGHVNFTLDLSQSSNAALKSSGGSVISHRVIVVNTGGNFIALSDICTHQGCSVYYNKKRKPKIIKKGNVRIRIALCQVQILIFDQISYVDFFYT